jgi:hypothetical protein
MVALFAELTTTRSDQISAESIGMEKAQENYSQEDESIWMEVHLGIEGTNSNGHGDERNKNMNMVETIKNLQRMSKAIKLIMKGL